MLLISIVATNKGKFEVTKTLRPNESKKADDKLEETLRKEQSQDLRNWAHSVRQADEVYFFSICLIF